MVGRTARRPRQGGATVEAVVDTRSAAAPLRPNSIPGACLPGAFVERVHGGHRVKSVSVRHRIGATTEIECDLLAVAGGWNPALHLTCHLGGKPVWNEEIAGLRARVKLPPGMSVAGAAAVISPWPKRSPTARGSAPRRAGELRLRCRARATASDRRRGGRRSPSRSGGCKEAKGKAFVDLAERRHHQGYRACAAAKASAPSSIVKRYTTLGMGTDQGKTANVAGAWHPVGASPAAASPSSAPPAFARPIRRSPCGALAGHHRGKDFRPIRLPPSHAWAEENGAVFVDAGLWLRAQWYRPPGRQGPRSRASPARRQLCGARSAFAMSRRSARSTFRGRTPATFLDRVYTNKFSTLTVGRARYGLMLREDGFAMDDGTTARFGDQHFVMTTTTANAGKVYAASGILPAGAVARARCRTRLGVGAMGAIFHRRPALARRAAPSSSMPAFDISNDGFPRMGAGELTICGGVPARLFRVSFSGELRLRDRRAGALRRRRDPRADAGRRRVRHHALRHRGAERAAHREGACRRAGDQRPDHGARSWPWRHESTGQGLHRQGACRAAGAARRRSGRSWSA